MKTNRLHSLSPSLLAFGAHPDDVEFGCGGVLINESIRSRPVHVVVCSRGESASLGTPKQRTAEAKRGAKAMGATVEFLTLDGDAHLELRVSHALKLAALIRRKKPAIVLAPTPAANQHPDHGRLGQLVRDAARLARYGGVKELRHAPAHAIDQLHFYAVTADAEANANATVLVDVSMKETMTRWIAAMEAHASQLRTRNYVELQLTRARLNGLRAGVEHAIALFPGDPLVIDSLSQLGRGARQF